MCAASVLFVACREQPKSRVVTASGATRPAQGGAGVRFVPVTDEAGIRFVHSFGDANLSNLVEAAGSGAAFFDYDNDGNLDIYLATGKFDKEVSRGDPPKHEATNRLYRNRGDGTFEDVTKKARVGCEGKFSAGVAVGDYDNDGYSDIYVCNYHGSTLYRNTGRGHFEDVTAKAGVANADGCAIAATWLDFDKDGTLDLYVANYLAFEPKYNLFYAPDGVPGPMAYNGQQDRFYRNRGDGTFEDATTTTGIEGLVGRAMSVASGDYDDDGYDDIYITNDAMENYLFRNEGGKRFRNVATELGVAYNSLGDSTASMSVDFGDFNNDGKTDIFVSDSSIGSLFRNDGTQFSDVAVDAQIAAANAQFVGWGSFFFDADNDGDLDIFKVNSDLSRPFGQEDQFFENTGDGRFVDASERSGDYFGQELMGRGACFGDVDNDGDLDVLILNLNGAPVLLRNDGGNRNNWLDVRLVGKTGNRDAFGAKVKVVSGVNTRLVQKRSASGYLSQSTPLLHFGLGSDKRVGVLEVTWPSGRKQALKDVEANRVLTLEEP
jgi:hypothetical protein